MRAALAAIDALIRAADAAGVSTHILRSAARALVDLEDELAATADPRKAATLEKARRALHSRESGVTRQQLLDRHGITKSTLDRWLRMARTSRASSEGSFSTD